MLIQDEDAHGMTVCCSFSLGILSLGSNMFSAYLLQQCLVLGPLPNVGNSFLSTHTTILSLC